MRPPDRPPSAGRFLTLFFAAVAFFHRGRRDPGLLATLAVVLALSLLGAWSAGLFSRASFTKEPSGYYTWQAAGFLAGHLHSAVEPRPELLALPDPYDPVANAPYRAHDMSLYNGKYYLYFGVPPILLHIIPLKWLTGHYPTENLVVWTFVSVSQFFLGLLLLSLRRRYFPDVPRFAFFAVLLGVGLAHPGLLLLPVVEFYHVPIACAAAFTSLGLWCLRRLEPVPARLVAPLLGASLCFGLAMASRPNTLLAAFALGLPLWWYWQLRAPARPKNTTLFGLAAAAFGPVGLIGVGLLIFNFLRFDSPTEFGTRYQLAGFRVTDVNPIDFGGLIPHSLRYLFEAAWWQPYFPFLEPHPDAPVGPGRYFPLVWLAAGLLLWRRLPSPPSEQGFGALLLRIIAWIGAANLVMLSSYAFQPLSRYGSDYVPHLLLLGALGALTLLQLAPWRRLVSVGVVLVVAASAAANLAHFIQRHPPARQPARLATLLDRPVAWLQILRGYEHGALRLDLTLPPPGSGATAADPYPILQSGYVAGRQNFLNLHTLSGNRARLVFFHDGLGEITGEIFPLPADRRLTLTIRFGALLPPATHPIYVGWTPHEITQARRKLEINVNDVPRLSAALDPYLSRPWDVKVGEIGTGRQRRTFAGQIHAAEKLPLARETVPPREWPEVRTPVRLTLHLPAVGAGFQPLIATGSGQSSDLVFLNFGPRSTFRLGLDHYGRGAAHFSRPLTYQPGRPVILDLWLGAWADATKSADLPLADRVTLLLDGQEVFNLPFPMHPAADAPTAFGFNRNSAGSAGPEFAGRILAIEALPFDALPALAQPPSSQNP